MFRTIAHEYRGRLEEMVQNNRAIGKGAQVGVQSVVLVMVGVVQVNSWAFGRCLSCVSSSSHAYKDYPTLITTRCLP